MPADAAELVVKLSQGGHSVAVVEAMVGSHLPGSVSLRGSHAWPSKSDVQRP